MIPFIRRTFRLTIYPFVLPDNVIRPRNNDCQDKFNETGSSISLRRLSAVGLDAELSDGYSGMRGRVFDGDSCRRLMEEPDTEGRDQYNADHYGQQ
jgi:hypothetical protein